MTTPAKPLCRLCGTDPVWLSSLCRWCLLDVRGWRP